MNLFLTEFTIMLIKYKSFLSKSFSSGHTFIAIVLCLLAISFSSCKREITEPNQIASNMVKFVFIDPDGKKWFATDKGISSFDNNSWHNYSYKNGLPQGLINAIEASKTTTGLSLWLASNNGLANSNVQSDLISGANIYTKDDVAALPNDTIMSLHRDKFNILWIGTINGLTGLKDAVTWLPQSSYAMSNFPITSIASSGSGRNYFATLGAGIARNISTVDAVTGASTLNTDWTSLPSDSIYSVCVDTLTGNQWFGTNRGAAYHQGTLTKENWTVYTTDDGLISNQINCIIQDQQGNIWFGTNTGVSKFNNINFTNYTITDGLTDNYINSIALDTDGSIWFATANGVSHYNGIWTNYISE
jgi:ligand-binding sensor domain-containing protein